MAGRRGSCAVTVAFGNLKRVSSTVICAGGPNVIRVGGALGVLHVAVLGDPLGLPRIDGVVPLSGRLRLTDPPAPSIHRFFRTVCGTSPASVPPALLLLSLCALFRSLAS